MSSMDDKIYPYIFGSQLKRMIWFKRIHEERDEILSWEHVQNDVG
jgi:hypothetical protein